MTRWSHLAQSWARPGQVSATVTSMDMVRELHLGVRVRVRVRVRVGVRVRVRVRVREYRASRACSKARAFGAELQNLAEARTF